MKAHATTPSAASPVGRGWPLSALLEPAVSGERSRRAWRSIAAEIAGDALSAAARDTVRLVAAPPREGMRAAWSAEFALCGARVRLLLDGEGARALADAASRALIGLRGAGALSPAELSLLEYLAVETLDHLASAWPGAGVVYGRVLTGADVPDVSLAGPVEAWFTLHAGAGKGTGAVLVSGALPGPPAVLAPAWDGAGSEELTTTAHLALPPFWMHAEELNTLAPGDVVLCGVGELASAAGCAVVTPTLWRLCNASVTELAATRMVASCEAWHPTPIECGPEGRARGVCSAMVLTGRAGPASVRAIGACIAAGRLEFANDPAGSLLAVDGRITARGEIVRCEGEIGLRVLEMIDNAEGGPSC